MAVVPADGSIALQVDAETAHAMPAAGVSLLRASATARLGIVAIAVGVLWLAVLWALS